MYWFTEPVNHNGNARNQAVWITHQPATAVCIGLVHGVGARGVFGAGGAAGTGMYSGWGM